MSGMGSDLDDLLANSSLDGLVGDHRGLEALIPTSAPDPAPEAPVAPTVPEPELTPAKVNSPFAGVEYSGDLEKDTAAELTEAQAAFRDRAKAYKRQRLMVEDSEFWVAVCFRTREDKETFLRDHGLAHLGDKYLNGYAVDAALANPPEESP